MKSYRQDHELQRQRLWAEAWVSVASANDCKSHSIATSWADAALTAFDSRFEAQLGPHEAANTTSPI